MKGIILVVAVSCVLTLAATSSADQPVAVADYSFVTYSPTSGAYAVQAALGASTTNWSVCARFHVFDTASGDMLWQSNTNYGRSGQVHLAPDPNYVVSVNTYFSTVNLRRNLGRSSREIVTRTERDGRIILSVNTDLSEKAQQDWLNKTWAVRIYRKESLLRSYSLKDLGIPLGLLRFSVSHADFAEVVQGVKGWDGIYFPSALGYFGPCPNPRFVGDGVALACLDGKTRVFDLKTGLIRQVKETQMFQQPDSGDSEKAAFDSPFETPDP